MTAGIGSSSPHDSECTRSCDRKIMSVHQKSESAGKQLTTRAKTPKGAVVLQSASSLLSLAFRLGSLITL